jgi:hypothetical protein
MILLFTGADDALVEDRQAVSELVSVVDDEEGRGFPPNKCSARVMDTRSA